MKAQIINTNAQVKSVKPKQDNVFNLKELQSLSINKSYPARSHTNCKNKRRKSNGYK